MSGERSRAHVMVHVAPTGNEFFDDIGRWIVEAAESLGRTATLVDDRLPADDGAIHLVLAPHEYFELIDATTAELQRAAAASICICTEQPGTPWFHRSVDACRRGAFTLDINQHGVTALSNVGISAGHLRLGSVPSITAPPLPGSVGTSTWERPLDLVFMGGLDDRRGAQLARLAPRIHRRAVDLRLFRFERPARSGTPGMVFGDDKHRLLSSSKLLLNIHRDRSSHFPPGATPPPYFEWARIIEAMANGCVVVSEPSEGFEPLVAGLHFVQVEPDQLGDVIDDLLDDEARRLTIAAAAFEAITGPLALRLSLGRVLDDIERDVLPRLAEHLRSTDPTSGLWRLGASKVDPPVRLGAFRPYRAIQSSAKRLALAENQALRRLDATACVLSHGTEQLIERIESASYADARPEVSVIVTVYNYADVVTETLQSIAASEDVRFEIIVVDDHATDHSRAVVCDFVDANPKVPIVLLGKDANEGLAAARNTGFDASRAPLVMVMDADNLVYPLCLRRLADALDDDVSSAAAYAILEDFGLQRNIRSALRWEQERMCRANYIDAQAMWRKSVWEQLGGYRDDDEHVFGWEDWDLWLRLADGDGHATLVPQILGRYRTQITSMITLTNLATDEAIDAIRARYLRLPWGLKDA